MLKTLKGFLAGAVVVGLLAFAAGYNHGRGAPIISNPFAAHTLADELRQKTEQAGDKLGKMSEQAKQKLRKELE